MSLYLPEPLWLHLSRSLFVFGALRLSTSVFSLLISITGIRWRGTLFSITEGSVFAGGKEPSGWL